MFRAAERHRASGSRFGRTLDFTWPSLAMALLAVPCLVAIVACIVFIARSPNGDNLYFAQMWIDLVRSPASIKTWQMQPAPSYVPDGLLFFLSMLLTHDPGVGLGLFCAVVLIGYAGFTYWTCAPFAGTRWALLAGAIVAALLGVSVWLEPMMTNVVYTNHHGLAMTAGIVGLVIMDRPLSLRYGVALFLLAFFFTVSDKIVLAWSLAPLSAVAGARCLRRPRARVVVDGVGWIAAIGVGALLGYVADRWIREHSGLTIASPPDGFNDVTFAGLVRFLQLLSPSFVRQSVFRVETILFAIAGVAALLTAGSLWRSRRWRAVGVADARLWDATVFFLATSFTSLCIAANIASYFNMRYLVPMMVMPGAYLVALVMTRRNDVVRWAASAACVLVVFLETRTALKKSTFRESIYLRQGRCLNAVAERHGVHTGMAWYTVAYVASSWSYGSVRTLSMLPHLEAHRYRANFRWWDDEAGKTGFFVFVPELDVRAIRARFGKPDVVEKCEGGDVYLYPNAKVPAF